ncbi:FAD-dependent oxidoreductase [Capillibacterium thermochitinicola]|uniref:FAD-dependent oxidoreductase n=1 Tax=Capillibacterium thermochitinicola TaxID=2699427 RepID=A0A8J6I3M3_9FIRM|nr:FAD-dependent oxidoreductase [Capillibacterium thermochitinicola]MBA2133874.1 FAD-dependent oxidoreductase [Capillibacterium thermochitinicola]
MANNYDIIVSGGGPGGIAAAVSAARQGKKVLLVERYGFLGGGATAMLVNPFMTYFAGQRQIVKGIFQEVVERLTRLGAFGNSRMPVTPWAFDAEMFKLVADQLCLENRVEVLFHASVVGAKKRGKEIKALVVATKEGLKKLTATLYIDATGDGDVAYFAGAKVEKGRRQDGLCQPMTLNFQVANVDLDKMPSREEMTAKYRAAKANGLINCPREDVLFFYTTNPGVVHFNQTRVLQCDGTRAADLSMAELEGRRQCWEFFQWLKAHVPGFEFAYLQKMAPQIGVRETRRVIGEYVLTEEDLMSARKFPDVVACGSYPVDIHNPQGEGTIMRYLPEGEWYDIPYRALLPLGIDNLLIAGRSISSTHEAHSSLRVMPIVFAIGQAAGTAAALSVAAGRPPRQLDYRLLQKELLTQGAFLGAE